MTTAARSTNEPEANGFDDKIKARVAEARTNLDRRLHDLEKTHAKHVARAKRKIKADVAKAKKATGKLGARLRPKATARSVAAPLVAALALAAGAASLHAAPPAQTVIYAVYDGQDTASHVFTSIRAAQGSQTGERIESYAVVSKDMNGKVTVRDQRKRDAAIGAVLGGVIGLVGGPAGVAAGAAAGGAVGYLTGDAVGIPRDKVESMRTALTPNSSALVVVLDDTWVQDTERSLRQLSARQVIASQIVSGQKTK